MKTLKNLFTLTALLIASFTFTFAEGGHDTLSTTCTSTELVEQIKEEVSFPGLTEMYGYEAQVKVSFEIDTESKIHVLSTESDSEIFNIHVKESLDGMEVNGSLDGACGVYETNISF